MFRLILILLILTTSICQATNYYVRTNGNDSNTGTVDTSGGAWLTITKAIATATAGDHVYIRQGVYSEYLTNSTSGTAGNPIIFEGERDSTGWLTEINPSTLISNGWVQATEIDTTVYKKTNMAFACRELTINHQRVAFVYSNGPVSSISSAYSGSGYTAGTNFLKHSSGGTLTMTVNNAQTVTWWNSVGALWSYESNGLGHTVYLRLRDGSNPEGMSIRAARNTDNFTTDMHYPAIHIVDQSFITWTNIMIRDSFGGFYLNGQNCHHVNIESNYVSGGYVRIHLAVKPWFCVIRGNTLTANYYGYNSPGAWQDGTDATSAERANIYLIAKYLMSTTDSSFDEGIEVFAAGATNSILWNTLSSGIGVGISMGGNLASYPVCTNTLIYSNYIAKVPSAGILLSDANTQTRVYDNYISDCNLNFRPHHMDTASETDRKVYIFRNRCYLPTNIGRHFYIHFNNGSPSSYVAEFWVYHNSFSGGFGIESSTFAFDEGGLTNFFVLNNIFSGGKYWFSDASAWTNTPVGAFDYNLINTPFPSYPSTNPPTFFQAHNIIQSSAEWSNLDGMTFDLLAGSRAIDAGLDLPDNYVLLPQDTTVEKGVVWDIGALEFEPGILGTRPKRIRTIKLSK